MTATRPAGQSAEAGGPSQRTKVVRGGRFNARHEHRTNARHGLLRTGPMVQRQQGMARSARPLPIAPARGGCCHRTGHLQRHVCVQRAADQHGAVCEGWRRRLTATASNSPAITPRHPTGCRLFLSKRTAVDRVSDSAWRESLPALEKTHKSTRVKESH